jgi:hypothetical protein
MPYGLDAHVLTVDANVLHKVDTGNLDNLFSMWAVFNKCADSVEQGRRLENLSWRLWQREQFCCDEKTCLYVSSPSVPSVPALTPSPTRHTQQQQQQQQPSPRSIPSTARIPDDVPRLSSSVDSNNDDDAAAAAAELSSVSLPLDFPRPMIRRQDSSTSTRSRRERHITADDFEKMVSSIINTKEPVPLSAPEPPVSRPAPRPVVVSPQQPPAVVAPPPTTTAAVSSSLLMAHSQSTSASTTSPPDLSLPHMTPNTQVVHGFSPSQVHVAISPPAPEPVSAIIADMPGPDAAPAKEVQPRKQAKFALGGSYSSSEPDSLRPDAAAAAAAMTTRLAPPQQLAPPPRGGGGGGKRTSFASTVLAAQYDADEAAIDSESDEEDFDDDVDDDDMDESAIEDDESSEWEDSVEESGRSSTSIDESVFRRDNSKVHLPSRPSLITLMIEGKDRDVASASTSALSRMRGGGGGLHSRMAPTAAAARAPPASSPNDSDDAGLLMKRAARSSNLGPIREAAARGPRAQPIAAPHHPAHHVIAPACLSPRTTRNHMVQAELTASLRVGIVHARKQNGLGLQRRHTSHDVTTIKQLPEKKPFLKPDADESASSLSRYLMQDTFNGYHDRGW